MTEAQDRILATVRETLGETVAVELEDAWRADGLGAEPEERITREELRRLVAWRFDANPQRRRIAIARLGRHGYDVTLARIEPERSLEARVLEGARS